MPPVKRLAAPPATVGGTARAAALSCWSVDYPVRATSWLGTTLYVFHHALSWCGNGSQVTNIYNRYSYFTEVSGTAFPETSPIADQVSTFPAANAWSFYQRRVSMCTWAGGCYGSNSPWIRLNLTGTGTYTAQYSAT
ncbi:hypothetical protein [Streptomyces xantholiticus]|uniref:hypothetical protein n=1 Tax=Streptomyces xantholiticus TaxID=68285 RepID=UPI0016743160|nr:hypothetical protein [Streptomyces xantholiticus]